MESGTLADRVMAVITAAGFAGAVVQLRINLGDSRAAREQARQEEEENREAMARAVGLKSSWQPGPNGRPPEGSSGLIPVEVEIVNSAPYPIRGAVLELPTDDEDHPMEVVYGTILPGEHLKDTYEVSAARSSSANSRAERRLCSRTPTATTGRPRPHGAGWNAAHRPRASADDQSYLQAAISTQP